MTKTYKQVIGAFETLASKHYQINGFINNHPLEINSADLTFPVAAIYPGASTLTRGAMYLNFNFFVMDLLNSDYSNEKEILSDTLQIGNDFIQELYQNETKYGFVIDENSVTMEPFAENFESSEDTDIADDVAGWYFSFTVEIQNDFNDCNLPFSS